MAVMTVSIGSLWSGYVKHYLRIKLAEEAAKRGERGQAEAAVQDNDGPLNVSNNGGRDGDEEQICENGDMAGGQATEDISLRISPKYVLLYVLLMCALLVGLYFFIDYLGKSDDIAILNGH